MHFLQFSNFRNNESVINEIWKFKTPKLTLWSHKHNSALFPCVYISLNTHLVTHNSLAFYHRLIRFSSHLKNKSEVSGHTVYRPPQENSFKLYRINKIATCLKWHYNFTVGITKSLISTVTKGRIH